MKISQKIIDYAIWYYLRYYPSIKKLENKLKQKFGPDSKKGKIYGGINDEEINYILEEKLKNIIQEKEVLRSKIKSYIAKNKNLNYIKQKLREKLFSNEMIDELLQDEFLSEGESLLTRDYIRKQINLYKSKGKSRLYIKQKLIERDEDKILVESLLKEAFLDGELEQINFEYEKLNGKYEKNKVIEKLLRKGFSYNDIKKIIDRS
ncbi:MAG: RecX family transcriptional regulator [Candidatus Gracilibacteria bacterium]|nr:RecX family transcriptional regulator [Candidatus Gracilibacteria bacterium]